MALRSLDLMIGDWVSYKRLNRQIIRLTKYPDGRETVNISSGTEIKVDDICPVVLTRQILEYNGFQILDGIHWWYDDFYFPINNSVRTPSYCGCDVHKFDYVHELQHALRLCGIEKEIVL